VREEINAMHRGNAHEDKKIKEEYMPCAASVVWRIPQFKVNVLSAQDQPLCISTSPNFPMVAIKK
jgi:hypothetical protein